AAALPKSLRKQLAQHDARIFYRVMLVHVQIARGMQRQVEPAMLGEQLQHVIEEADARGDIVHALAFDHQGARDLRLFRDALDGCGSHKTVSSSLILSKTAIAFS